jgi:hypothetical protein
MFYPCPVIYKNVYSFNPSSGEQRMKSETKAGKYKNYGRISLSAIAAAFFVVITAVFPMYMTRLGYFMLTRQKADFFVTVTGLAAGATAFAFFLTSKKFRIRDYFTENEPRRPVTVPEWAFLAFIILAFLSAVFSPWQDFVWRGFTTNGVHGRWEGFWVYLCYFLTYAIISRFHRPKRWHFIVFAGGAVLVCLYGLLQYLGMDVLEYSGFFYIETGLAPLTRLFRTTLGNINVVSGYCSLIIPLFAALYAGEDSKWGLFYLLASVMGFAMLCITKGDAGRVGVLGGMSLMIPYWVSNRQRLSKILIVVSTWSAVYAINQAYVTSLQNRLAELTLNRRDMNLVRNFTPSNTSLFFTLAAVFLVIGLVLYFIPQKWPSRLLKIAGATFLVALLAGGLIFVETQGREGQRGDIFWEARELLHGRADDRLGNGRIQIWKYGVSVILNSPMLGTGPDTFFFALGGIQIEPTETTMDNLFPGIVAANGMQLQAINDFNVIFDKAHNIFLQIAVCMGIPALLAFIVFLSGTFHATLKKTFDRPILLAFTVATLSYVIQAFFQIDTPIDRPLMFVALGVVSGEVWRGKAGVRYNY